MSLLKFIFSFFEIFCSTLIISASEIFLNTTCVVLLLMVSITLSGSVVASIKITCSGGSSNVLRNAFDAAFDNI